MKRAIQYISIMIAFMLIATVFSVYTTLDITYRKFGVTYMTMNNPFYEVINNELKKVIETNGDKLITLDPALDIEKQKEQIYSFIEQKVDGIFVNPIDSQKIKPALKKLKKQIFQLLLLMHLLMI